MRHFLPPLIPTAPRLLLTAVLPYRHTKITGFVLCFSDLFPPLFLLCPRGNVSFFVLWFFSGVKVSSVGKGYHKNPREQTPRSVHYFKPDFLADYGKVLLTPKLICAVGKIYLVEIHLSIGALS